MICSLYQRIIYKILKMFKSMQMGAALTFLSQDARAAKVSYRPTPGSTPWYSPDSGSTW